MTLIHQKSKIKYVQSEAPAASKHHYRYPNTGKPQPQQQRQKSQPNNIPNTMNEISKYVQLKRPGRLAFSLVKNVAHSLREQKNLSQPGQNRTRMGNKAKMNRRSARSSKCRQILKLTSSHTEPTKHWQPHNDLLSCRHHDEVCTYLAGSRVFCLQQTNKSCRVFSATFFL